MTEYWVSKKQYWCKYCNIYIRDDAPSRKQHETGLKHQGNKERFIRDLYRNGNRAKIEKAEEAAEMARIEAAALGTGASSSKLSTLEILRQAQATSHKAREPSRPKDKFANYSSAADLGFQDEETAKSAYEIEQELKGRAGEIGGWETVDYEPVGLSSEADQQPSQAQASGSSGGKRKLGEYAVGDDEDHEGFRIQPRKKDPYADDEWDPRSAIKGKAKIRVKVEDGKEMVMKGEEGQALDRTAWTGKLVLAPAVAKRRDREPADHTEMGLRIKEETGAGGANGHRNGGTEQDIKPDIGSVETAATVAPATSEPVKGGPACDEAGAPVVKPEPLDVKPDPDASSTLFKKRRPPPSSRKK